jgi:carboxymethylenebutenolidase
MKRLSLHSAIVLMAFLVTSIPAVVAQQNGTGGSSSPRTFAALGTIANIQFEDDAPAWILSGGWKLRANITSEDNASATFEAATRMVMMDGTAMHMHRISDFALERWSEVNNTLTFTGTATITLRDGPHEGVPVTITIMNVGALSLNIDEQVVDHFGSEPIYGMVLRSFDSRPSEVPDDSETPPVVPTPTNGTQTLQENVTRSNVEYYPNATGYLAYPTNGSSLPAVVMIHEWWGLNQNIKNEAERLASQGYAVLAVDLYSGRVATQQEDARTYVTEVRDNPDTAIDNLQAAVTHLSEMPNVNSSRIASLGWCFGGGQSLQLALNSEKPLAATVIYYGNLVTEPQELAEIDWPVLGIFGATDQSIPVDTVRQFEAALDANDIPNEIHVYEGVGHAFANPSGDNYAPDETADAWAKTLAFLRENV